MQQWPEPLHDRTLVDRAGAVLAEVAPQPSELDDALTVINNWRSAHQFPLNTFQSTLRDKTAQFRGSVVVQRVKRLRAVQHKLRKHTKKPISLSEMQDIGGCRAVLGSYAQMRRLRDAYLHGRFKHDLLDENDYILKPKFSGYRGIHLVYAYKSETKTIYNGLKIEIQLRSQLQHAWATAVEMVGFFRRELLKSGEGDNIWKHFFKLMAAEIAYQEKAPFGIPGMPQDRKSVQEQLRRCAVKCGALAYLRTVGGGITDIQKVDIGGAHWYLLELDILARRLKVTGYKLSARAKATMDYAAVEKQVFGSREHDSVLVSAESMSDLKRAYTNYFFDVHRFIATVAGVCENGGVAG